MATRRRRTRYGYVRGTRGRKPIRFKKGALHRQLGVPAGRKIPASKMRAARAGRYGKLAKRRALFAKNVLTGGRRKRRRR